MTAQNYIQSKLDDLRTPLGLEKIADDALVAEAIFKAITSKKFRKYSLSPEQSDHIKSSIALNIQNKEPIKATLVFGGYKLWRLEETPEVDWAELFSLMYYTNWVKPICEIYEPGIWFDFFSDDVIVPKMNNVSPDDTKIYQDSFKKLLVFLKAYQPENLNMTLNRVGDQYESYQAFETDLEDQMKTLAANLEGGLPVLNDVARATLDLNVRTTPEQLADPLWHEKVQLMHDGYAQVKGRRPYYRQPDKFNIMTTPLNGMLAVGTTKDTIMKFWIGAGVLKPRDDTFRQIIFSPNQLERSQFELQPISIVGLSSKNFSKVRVLKEI
ncbi:MAG: hypothetical protein JWM81_499 [Candidatus Saccharibacteria bacterium]|nr:hypothetical protein [Candidatus Saccharibacteria bacterium]